MRLKFKGIIIKHLSATKRCTTAELLFSALRRLKNVCICIANYFRPLLNMNNNLVFF